MTRHCPRPLLNWELQQGISCLGGNMSIQISVLPVTPQEPNSAASTGLSLATDWDPLHSNPHQSRPASSIQLLWAALSCCEKGLALLHAQPNPCFGAKASRDAASKGEVRKSWEQVALVSPESISKINLCRDKSPEIFIWRISWFSVNPIVNPTEVTGFFLLPFSPWLSLSTYIKING